MVRGLHLSQIKARLLGPVEDVFSQINMQQATSGTSAATYKLIEPYYPKHFVKLSSDDRPPLIESHFHIIERDFVSLNQFHGYV